MVMKGINNRQKTIVRPRESIQKYVMPTGKLQKGMATRKVQPLHTKSGIKRKGSV
jgi:hypothetical protein